MISLELGELAEFPFVEPPDAAVGQRRAGPAAASSARSDAGRAQRLTEVGRALAALPVDPRLGRMLVEAHRTGCLREVLVIAAALSVQDPRERPDRAAPGRRRPARPVRRRVHRGRPHPGRRRLRLPGLRQPVELPRRAARGAVRQPLPPAAARGVPALPAHPGVAGPARPAARGGPHAPACGANDADADPDRHPHRGAVRAAQPGRAAATASARRTAAGTGRGKRGGPRVPRRPRRQVHDLPRVAAGPEAAALGDGRRAGGDLPAVRPHRGPDRPGLDRAAGRAPGPALLLGAALVPQAGGGGGHRAGHPARHPDRRRPDRRLRADRRRAVPRAVHPARAGRGRLGHPAPVLPRQPRAARRRRGAGAPGPPARPGGRRARPWSTSTSGGSRPRWCPGGTSTAGGSAPRARQPDAARLHRGDAAHRAGRQRRPRRLPRPRRRGRAHAAAVLRVRTRARAPTA